MPRHSLSTPLPREAAPSAVSNNNRLAKNRHNQEVQPQPALLTQKFMPQSDIKTALEKINARRARYQEFYDYYGGKHALNFASEKFKNKFGRRLQKLRENLCKIVVTAPASRLEVINFLADKKNTENPAWKLWKQSKMPLHSGAIHREAIKTGDAYVLVWKDQKGKVRFYPQVSANMTVWRNQETGEIEKAAKAWAGADGFYYLNLYHADRIEKYVTRGKCATLPTDAKLFSGRHVSGESFPLVNPFNRVPVFHFRFDAELQDFGHSLLADVIPLNDTVNKSWADIMGAQEENMRRRRYVAGLQTETDDETGKPINPYKPDDDLWMANEEAQFGEFSDADLQQMIAVLTEAVKAIALVSGIPPSYFNLESVGSAISGEALRKIEARFTALVQDAQRSFGETWGEIINFGLEINNDKTEALEIETQWTDASPVSETEMLDNAQKKISLGWSYEQVQRDYGLTDEQIEKMKTENLSREKSKMEMQQKFFDQGNNLIEE